MSESEPTRAIFRLGDETRAGRPRRRSAIAAGLILSGVVDAALAGSGLSRPIVLVSGFWRSGTTWLQESLVEGLSAKSIFEPLSPQEPRRRAALQQHFPDDEDALQAFIPGPLPEASPVWRALDHACRGRVGGPFLLSCRGSVAEATRRAIVVKDVRLHHNLATFHRRFRMPVVHIRRHPCAVVASLRAADWHWSFSRVRLADLGPVPEDVLVYDTDDLSRMAAYWAFVESRASLSLTGQAWAQVLSYEALAADPAPVFAALCRRLGLRQRREVDFGRPAASIHPDRFTVRSTAREPGREPWRARLAEADIARIETIADAVFPAWRAPIDLHAPVTGSP